MKSEELFEILGDVNEIHVQEARTAKAKASRARWVKWGAAAACLALAVCAGVFWMSRKAPGGDVLGLPEKLDGGAPGLPMLTVTEDTGETMGFEGYMAFDISELVNANPWSESAGLTTMPVYKNALTYNEYYMVSGGNFDEMRAFLLDVAGRLGLDAGRLEITDNSPSKAEKAKILEKTGGDLPEGYFDPTAVIAKADGVKIEVGTEMTATITFDPAVSLPGEYHFAYHTSYEDAAAVAGYLQEAYRDLIGMEKPQANVYGGDYTFDGEQGYQIEFFDCSGSLTGQIVNCNFNRVAFYCDEEGNLSLARVFAPDLSEKVGDYPIITVEEARALLFQGNYITTVLDVLPKMDCVAKAELIYRTGKLEEYYMPYYRFYVELPEWEREGGLKTYGTYYVPAVEGKYLANMPVWDGSFN